MKKTLLTIFIFFTALQAYGFEDYIILSDLKVDSVYSKDESIVSIVPFYTIDNGKETLILKAKSEGNTEIIIETSNENITLNVEITDKKTTLSESDRIKAFPIDFMQKPKKPVLRGE